MLEAPGSDGSREQELKMAGTAADPVATRAYLLRQSMYESLSQAAEIE
jgi:hypothetical protein